jgi:hypothetical protein|nr:MAG TPA: GTPase [Caudoviricetes sp.]
MKCYACGRELKSPRSREVGYGPVYYRTVFGTSMKQGNDKTTSSDSSDFPYYEIPGQMSIEDYLGSNDE